MIRRLHHVGIVVRDTDEALGFFRDTLGLPIAGRQTMPDQGVKATLLALGDAHLELVEPTDPDTGVGRFLERRGEGLHHLCFETEDIEGELGELKRKQVELIDQEPREGLAGLIAFLHPSALHGVLVELAQPLD